MLLCDFGVICIACWLCLVGCVDTWLCLGVVLLVFLRVTCFVFVLFYIFACLVLCS